MSCAATEDEQVAVGDAARDLADSVATKLSCACYSGLTMLLTVHVRGQYGRVPQVYTNAWPSCQSSMPGRHASLVCLAIMPV